VVLLILVLVTEVTYVVATVVMTVCVVYPIDELTGVARVVVAVVVADPVATARQAAEIREGDQFKIDAGV
jgi:hypothetical protein